MDTLRRPERSTRSSPVLAPFGYALLALGYGLMVLGILEIGGLLSVGVGLAAVTAGCVLRFWNEGTANAADEAEEFLRGLE